MLRQVCKFATAQTKVLSEPLKPRSELMPAWQFQSFGGLDQLKLKNVVPPQVKKPNDVLVKVYATSVNPLDVAMIGKILYLVAYYPQNLDLAFPLLLYFHCRRIWKRCS